MQVGGMARLLAKPGSSAHLRDRRAGCAGQGIQTHADLGRDCLFARTVSPPPAKIVAKLIQNLDM